MAEEMTQEEIAELRADAQAKLREAEKAYYVYAGACEVGRERIHAFTVYENVRTAAMVMA